MVIPEGNLDILQALAGRIRLVRGELSRVDFAKKLGIHLNTLGHYERGQRVPDALVLINICNLFAVKPTWLILGEGPALDEERIIVEPARAGTLRAGDSLARIVVKEKGNVAGRHKTTDKISFSITIIQDAIISVEQALNESGKRLSPEKKAELVVAACELLADMDNAEASDKLLKLIRLSA